MSCQAIEDLNFGSVDHLQINKRLDYLLSDLDVSTLEKYVVDLSNHTYTSKKNFTIISQQLQKLHHMKPRNVQINFIYRKLLQHNKIIRNKNLESYLVSKSSRVSSGIQQISVLTSPGKFSCKHGCAYCPEFEGMPKSYIPNEPACRRATQNDFQADLQFWDRASSYSLSGHSIDKIECIILGGTFDDYDEEYTEEFIRDLFYAANTFYDVEKRQKKSLLAEQSINESAICKIIGMTIETRPDYINQKTIEKYIKYGVTRVQFGIQSIYDDVLKLIKRGCTHQDSINASRILHDCGYKFIVHIMPNLPYPDEDGNMYTCVEKDEEMFDYLINSSDIQADEWKVYPTSVTIADTDEKAIPTKLEKWFTQGRYVPYSDQDVIELALRVKTKLFEKDHTWLRITRFIRDIPIQNIQGGASIPNARQIIHQRLRDEGKECPCIRCREIRNNKFDHNDVFVTVKCYKASGGTEYHISKNVLIQNNTKMIGFIRLRLSSNAGSGFLKNLQNSALIRELHVYGNLKSTIDQNDKNISNSQHKGYGKDLLKLAEKIAINNGFKKMSIISGVGTRNYYRKFGYELENGYMSKVLISHNYIMYILGILCLIFSLVFAFYK